MYDRAPRNIHLKVGCTPDHVGPGTYEHRKKKLAEESYAPFLSLSSRGDIFPNGENPGPGYYELRNVLPSTIKGGSTLANKAIRFNTKLPDDTPGPGAYELYISHSPRSTTADTVKQPRQNPFRFNRKSLPPSIPDPKFAYGFEEDDRGTLVPQQPPVRDGSLGPAFYNATTTVENDPTKAYQGVHFSKYSSKRTDFSGKAGPGPGDYDPADPVKLEIQHINLKSWDRRPELQIPRYPDVLQQSAAKESIPGPGQYSIKRDLDPQPSKTDITGIEFERPPFGTQTRRFQFLPSGDPGPTTYDDRVLTAFNNSLTKPTSLKRIPFNQSAARFIPFDYKTSSAPGPGQYRIAGFTDENLRRAVVEGGKKPPFNVTSTRQLQILRKDDFNTPGPSSYDIKSQPYKPKAEHPSANFVSKTAREIIIEDMPGPTAYDVSRSYQALVAQNKKSPRSIHARKRHSQFLSAAKRIFAGEVTTDTPGPGAYDSLMHSHPHGFASVRAPRFHSQSSKLPGPADYELSPLFEDTILRGTFNATLNNPILAKLQSRALRDEKETVRGAASFSSLPVVVDKSTNLATTHA